MVYNSLLQLLRVEDLGFKLASELLHKRQRNCGAPSDVWTLAFPDCPSFLSVSSTPEVEKLAI